MRQKKIIKFKKQLSKQKKKEKTLWSKIVIYKVFSQEEVSANGEVMPLARQKAIDPLEITKKDKIANNKKA